MVTCEWCARVRWPWLCQCIGAVHLFLFLKWISQPPVTDPGLVSTETRGMCYENTWTVTQCCCHIHTTCYAACSESGSVACGGECRNAGSVEWWECLSQVYSRVCERTLAPAGDSCSLFNTVPDVLWSAAGLHVEMQTLLSLLFSCSHRTRGRSARMGTLSPHIWMLECTVSGCYAGC